MRIAGENRQVAQRRRGPEGAFYGADICEAEHWTCEATGRQPRSDHE